jgi:type IV pilus assembly protein PilM
MHPDTNRPTIIDSFMMPTPAGAASAAKDSSEMVAAALSALLEQKSLADSAVALGISSQKTLMRFFGIPRLDRKRTSEVMQYEVKQQIPVPLETMAWDYQVLSPEQSLPKTAAASEDEIALFAAKLDDVQTLLQPFSDRGIKVDLVQSAGAALYNFLAYERFSSAAEKLSPSTDRRIEALLDVGAESSTLLVTDGQTMFIRNIPAAGDHFTKAICKQYKLDRTQGEALKRNPTAAKLLHRLYEALQPGLQNLSAEVQKSIEQYTRLDQQQAVQQLLVIGGGAKLHGLLRYLNSGRSA